MKPTKTDQENLEKVPVKKWFGVDDVFPQIKRPRYSLDRLCKLGLLEWKVVGIIPLLTIKYKKK